MSEKSLTLPGASSLLGPLPLLWSGEWVRMGCLFGEGPQKRVAPLSYLFERGHVTSPRGREFDRLTLTLSFLSV